MSKIRALDHIGRMSRSTKNEKLENFLTDLQRLTIVHETDHGGSYFRFASGNNSPKANGDAAGGDDDKKGAAKSGDAKKKAADAKSSSSSSSGDKTSNDSDPATDGDKTMADQHGTGDKAQKAQKDKQQSGGLEDAHSKAPAK